MSAYCDSRPSATTTLMAQVSSSSLSHGSARPIPDAVTDCPAMSGRSHGSAFHGRMSHGMSPASGNACSGDVPRSDHRCPTTASRILSFRRSSARGRATEAARARELHPDQGLRPGLGARRQPQHGRRDHRAARHGRRRVGRASRPANRHRHSDVVSVMHRPVRRCCGRARRSGGGAS